MVKDRGEIEAIRSAGKVTAEVFAELLPHIRPGVIEQDLAAEIEYRMRKKGAEGAAFEIDRGLRAPLCLPPCAPFL